MNYNFQEGYEQATVKAAIPSMVSPAITLAVVALVETYLGVSVDSDGVAISFESDAPHHATVQCDLLCPKKAQCSEEVLGEISKDVLDEGIKMRMTEYELPEGLQSFAVTSDGTVDYMDLSPSTTTTTNMGLVFGSFSVFYETASLPANWEEKLHNNNFLVFCVLFSCPGCPGSPWNKRRPGSVEEYNGCDVWVTPWPP